MSIQSEISRIEVLRNKIRTKLVAFGLVQSAAKLEACVTAVESIEDRGTVNVTVKEGESYTIQKGYYKGGSVAGVSGGGNYTLQTKEVTPSREQQVIASDDGYYGLSEVTVEPIPQNYQDVSGVTLTKEKALEGFIFVDADGVQQTGSMKNNGGITKSMDGLNTMEVTIPEGYTTGGTVTLTTAIEEALAAI